MDTHIRPKLRTVFIVALFVLTFLGFGALFNSLVSAAELPNTTTLRWEKDGDQAKLRIDALDVVELNCNLASSGDSYRVACANPPPSTFEFVDGNNRFSCANISVGVTPQTTNLSTIQLAFFYVPNPDGSEPDIWSDDCHDFVYGDDTVISATVSGKDAVTDTAPELPPEQDNNVTLRSTHYVGIPRCGGGEDSTEDNPGGIEAGVYNTVPGDRSDYGRIWSGIGETEAPRQETFVINRNTAEGVVVDDTHGNIKVTITDSDGSGNNCTVAIEFSRVVSMPPGQYDICATSHEPAKCETIEGTDNAVHIQGEQPEFDSQEGDGDDNSCESKGAAGWFLCPSVRLIDEGTKWLDNEIAKLLEINTDVGFQSNPELQEAAANIRNVAFSILIPIMLVMIISTALGFEFVSAYTVKKALPRLVIAVIFIAVSYPLLSFIVDFVEVIGRGTAGFIAQPFGGINNLNLSQLMPGGLTLLVEGPAIVWGTIIIIWLFGIPILAAVAIAFLTLLLRQMFIVGLVLLAPLAILAWIFPGNDKLWDGWRKTFTILLLMYPIIMGLIALGRIFASLFVGDNVTDQAAIVDTIFAFFAYLLPYAFIPFVFKIAGGLFGTVTGALDNRSKGFFDKQRAKRAEKWSGYKAGTEAPIGLRGENFAAKGFRRAGANIGAGAKGRFGVGAAGAAARSANLRAHAANTTMKDPTFQQIQHDDLAMRAATYTNAKEAEKALIARGVDAGDAKAAAKKVQGTIGYGQAQGVAASQQMLLNKTAYENSSDVAQTIARVSGGSGDVAASLRGFNNAYAKQVGRHDLSAVSSSMVNAAMSGSDQVEIADPTTGTSRQASWDDANRDATVKGFENADTFTLGRENAKSYENMARANADDYRDRMQAFIAGTGSREDVVAARARLEESLQSAGSANGINARAITSISDDVAYTDSTLSTARPAEAPAIIHDATQRITQGGVARAGQMSEAERRAREDAAGQQAQQDED